MPRFSEGKFALGALAAFAIWLTVGLPFLYGPSSHLAEQKHATAEHAGQSTNAKPDGTAPAPFVVQVIPSPKSAEERTQEAEEREEKKSADRWLVRWTAALFAATVGLILATGVLGYFGLHQSRDMKASIKTAEDANKLNREIFAANQRPWATVTAVNVIGLVQFAMGMRVPFELVVMNGGQTPAINLNWNCSAWLRFMSGTPQQLQAQFAAELIRDRSTREQAHIGHLVFPDVPLKSGTLTQMVQLPDDPRGFQIIIVGCLDYRFPGEGTYHQTGFMFQLARKRTTIGDVNDFGEPRLTFHNGEVLEAEELEFQPFPSGFFAT